MKILLVVNPVSGGVNKEPFLKEAVHLFRKYGIRYTLFRTTGTDDDRQLKTLIEKEQPDRIVSAGGDGTVLFSALVLLKQKIPMGIVPLGSANGMAAELNVNGNPIEALKDILLSQITSGLDMMVINNRHYSIHMGDVGINARIVEDYSKDPARGMVTYAKYFLEELKRLEPFEYTVKTGDKTVSGKAVMIALCNARKYGTGVPINLSGNPMDGKLEIVIINNVDIPMLIKAGLSRFNEKFHDSQNGKVISTTQATISFDKPRLLQLDGEVIGKFQNLDVSVIPGAVNLVTNRDNPYLNR